MIHCDAVYLRGNPGWTKTIDYRLAWQQEAGALGAHLITPDWDMGTGEGMGQSPLGLLGMINCQEMNSKLTRLEGWLPDLIEGAILTDYVRIKSTNMSIKETTRITGLQE